MQGKYLTGSVEIKTGLKVYGFRFLIIDTIFDNLTMFVASRADFSVRMHVCTAAVRSIMNFEVF
jgi:hypothetical protein